MPPMPPNEHTNTALLGRVHFKLCLMDKTVLQLRAEMQMALDRKAKPTRQCFQEWLDLVKRLEVRLGELLDL